MYFHENTGQVGRNKKALVATFWSGRWYFLQGAAHNYASKAAAGKFPGPQECAQKPPKASLVKSLRRAPEEVQFKGQFPWHLQNDLSSVPPGHYWVYSSDGPQTEDEDMGHTMYKALQLFLKSGRYPLIQWAHYPRKWGNGSDNKPLQFEYVKTTFDGEGQEGSIVVRSMARDHAQNAAWASKLGVPYGGQSVGFLARMAFDALLRRSNVRCNLPEKQKAALMEQQDHKCAGCLDPLGSPEFDHIVPLCNGGSNELSNFQALCQQCHWHKTTSQGVPVIGYAKSRFNRDVFDKYVKSPTPPCLVFKNLTWKSIRALRQRSSSILRSTSSGAAGTHSTRPGGCRCSRPWTTYAQSALQRSCLT